MILKIMCNEIRYQLKNITYYGFFMVVLLMFFSQLGIPTAGDLKLPGQKENYYRTEPITDNIEKMKAMYFWLGKDYENRTISKYRFSFKYSANNNEKNYLKSAIDKIYTFDSENNMHINVSYDEYLDILKNLDINLKGGTIYGNPDRHGIYNKEISLENAEKNYKDIMEKDKFTNAYGRIFADYMGITAGLFPVFLSAFIFVREKKRNEYEKIYKSKISFTGYILGKYLGICICIMGCYFILATYTTLAYFKFSLDTNTIIDKIAIYKYTFSWIGPTVLFTTALGMLIAALFNSPIVAIGLQLILWAYNIKDLGGHYGLTQFVIRFNEFGEYDTYLQWKNAIIVNRVFYTIVYFVIVLLSAYIWNRFKRKNIKFMLI